MNLSLKEHLRRNITLAYPVMIGQLGHIMVNVADTIMVGRVGVISLAAATFGATFYTILMVFGIGISYSVTPLVAATDPKDKSKLDAFISNGFILNMLVSLLLVVLGVGASFFLGHFGQDTEVAREARPYLVVMIISLVPMMYFQTFRQYSEGQSETFQPMVVSIGANVLNIILNYFLIYGVWIFPELGLLGAGIATLIARVVMAIWMHVSIRQKISFDPFRLDIKILNQLRRIGLPSGMQYVFEIGAFAVAAIMAGWISPVAQAAHMIAINMAAVTYMVATGLGAAGTIRIGNQLGLKNKRDLILAGHSIMAMVIGFMLICGTIFILFRQLLVQLYIDNAEVQNIAMVLLVIAAGFQVSDGMQAVGLGILRGLTDVKFPTAVTFMAYWLVSIPLGYYLCFVMNLGINGIWYALVVGLSLAGVFHFFRFKYLVSRLDF